MLIDRETYELYWEELTHYKYRDTIQQCQLSIVPLEFSGDDIARIRFFKGGK